MIHREQITVYCIEHLPDGYGGTEEFLQELPDAPKWMTITDRTATQVAFGGFTSNFTHVGKCNYKDGFTWEPSMVIYSPIQGYMKVDTIIMSNRLRGMELGMNRMSNEEIPNISM